MSNDLKNLSYRMTNQLDLAMNDLKNVKKNIKQIKNIIKLNYDRKIDEEKEEEAAGFIGRQHNMSHNRWISSLRNRYY